MRINFSKKALAVVMAVLMILSSMSAFAFAATDLATKNNASISGYTDKTDDQAAAVAGANKVAKFPKEASSVTDEMRAKYYHNVLYVPEGTVVKQLYNNKFGYSNLSTNDGTQYGTADFRYAGKSVLMADGVKNAKGQEIRPYIGLVAQFYNGYGARGMWYHVINIYSFDNSSHGYSPAHIVESQWYAHDSIEVFDYYGIMSKNNKSNNLLVDSNHDKSATAAKLTYDGKWDSENANNDLTSAKFGENYYYKTFKPYAFGFDTLNKGNDYGKHHRTHSAKHTNDTQELYVVNYAPLRERIVDANDLIGKVQATPDAYTNESVEALTALIDKLNAAKPDQFSYTDQKKGMLEYAKAADAAIKAYDEWNVDPVIGGLVKAEAESISLVNQTVVLDFDNGFTFDLNNDTLNKSAATVTYSYYVANPTETIATDTVLTASEMTQLGQKYKSIGSNTAVEGLNGVECKINSDGKLTYSVKNAKFDKAETLYVCSLISLNGTDKMGYKWEKITFVPANSIYIDDSSAAFTYTPAEKWNSTTAANVADEAAKLVGSGEVYGYSDAYANFETYSAGAAKEIKLSKQTNLDKANVSFTFKGTGFDVISVADSKSAFFRVEVKKGDAVVARKIVNTYSDWQYANGAWTQNAASADTLYQIPAIKIDGLAYDEYNVTIYPLYSSRVVSESEGAHFIFDGVRVYDPAFNDETANNIYAKDNEANAAYAEFSDLLISAEDLAAFGAAGGNTTTGVVVINDNGLTLTDSQIVALNAITPNHELYLAQGQSVSFQINSATAPTSVQVGAKRVNGAPELYDGYSFNKINTATEMYYKIKAGYEGVYTIRNITDGVLALTTLKCTFNDGAAKTFSLEVNEETPRIAMASINAPKADLSVKAQAPVVNDKTVTINATTSLDVAALNIKDAAGNAVDAKVECTVNGNVKNWTVTIVENAAGTYSYTISGEYAYGYTNASEAADVTVTIEEAEAPAPELTFGQRVVNFFKKLFGIKF